MENKPISVLHPETRHVDDIKLKNIQTESTLVTIIEDGVFGKLEVLLNFYHHFKCEWEWEKIQAMKVCRLTYGEMAASQIFEVKNFVKYCYWLPSIDNYLVFTIYFIVEKMVDCQQFQGALEKKDHALEEHKKMLGV